MATARFQESDAGRAPRSAARRTILLFGTSLLVYTALPTAAFAQNECGPPPPAGGTVTCPPGGNPYPGGIDYDPPGGLVADLTVVLEPGVVVANSGSVTNPNGVEIGSSTAGVDLSLQAGTNTQIGTTALSHDAVDVVATDGTVTVAVDDVSTTQDNSRGVVASGRGTVIVTADTVTTLGDNSDGISAEEGNFVSPGVPPSPGGTSVTVNSVSTAGDNSVGIIAFSENGDVAVDSGTVVTTGDFSRGILAISAVNDVRVTSDSVTTSGTNSVGIDAQIFPFPDEVVVGTVLVDSGTVATTGDGATGIIASSPVSNVTVNSDSISTEGDNASGISAFVTGQYTGPGTFVYGPGDIVIDSGTIATLGTNSDGIVAIGADDVTITSDSVSTQGHRSTGIYAASYFDGDVVITSGSVTTAGNTEPAAYGGAHGIEARADDGNVTINSNTVGTSGIDAIGILATSNGGAINITSGAVTTAGAGAIGISATTGPGSTPAPTPPVPPPADFAGDGSAQAAPVALPPDISITSTSVTTAGAGAIGISATTEDGDIYIESGSVRTAGADATGILAETKYGGITIDSGTVTTSGFNATGIEAAVTGGAFDKYGGGPVVVTSDSVTVTGGGNIGALTSGINATGPGDVTIVSGSVVTSGGGVDGISAGSVYGTVSVTSGTISTVGDFAQGIFANSVYGSVEVTNTVLIETDGVDSPAITAFAFYSGNVTVDSASIITHDDESPGINAQSAYGDVTVISDSVVTSGDYSAGIFALASTNLLDDEALETLDGEVDITSTTVSTSGQDSEGIIAFGSNVTVTSGTVTTTGADSTGIFARSFGVRPAADGSDDGSAIVPPGAESVLGPNGGTSVTSGSVTTSGANSHGIEADADIGDTEVFSTGTIATSGAGSHGIIANSDNGFVAVDANAINVTGAGSDAVVVSSATTSTVIVRGLVRSTSGFSIQANGGAATVSTTAGGTIRGRVDFTDNADTLNNAGTFDAIGTSAFGGGTDVFNNSGTTRSTNGSAVLGGLETFNNSGLIDFGDGAANDRLTVGNFNGSGNSRLTVDVDFPAGIADVLVTGVATGSTTIAVNAIGSQFGFNTAGILVVDATAGTAASAFSLAGGNVTNGYVTTALIFDAPNFNFLLVNAPGQAIFETAMVGGMSLEFWHQSADAVETQLEGARASGPGPTVGNLIGNGRFGGWLHVFAGETEREATQSFTSGGATTIFDVTYEQDFEGLQAGFDHQSGDTIFGVTFGVGRSDTQFATSPSALDMESMNLGVYAAFANGNFYANILAKVDWMDLETNPGPGLAAEFDAVAYGVRGVAGFRFDLGRFFAEPSVSLSWVSADIDDYTSGGATISFDNATSLRGTAGLRVGAALSTEGGGVLTPFAGIRAIEEFNGDNNNEFLLGTALNLAEDGPGTHGEASLGLTFTSGSVEAFVRGELDFGKDVDGRTVRGGVRLRF